MKSVLSLDDGRWSVPAEERTPLPSASLEEELFQLNIKQPSPPPVLAEVQRPISPSRVADPTPGLPTSGTARFQNLHVVSLKCIFFLFKIYINHHIAFHAYVFYL
jgi:STAM-binding protein